MGKTRTNQPTPSSLVPFSLNKIKILTSSTFSSVKIRCTHSFIHKLLQLSFAAPFYSIPICLQSHSFLSSSPCNLNDGHRRILLRRRHSFLLRQILPISPPPPFSISQIHIFSPSNPSQSLQMHPSFRKPHSSKRHRFKTFSSRNTQNFFT